MWVHTLDDARDAATCGGKAAGLARLVAAGLPVPDGFVLDARAAEAAALPPGLRDDVTARAAALGALAVRSSASLEDGREAAGAGIFASVVPATDPWPAIHAVWASARTSLAATYAGPRALRIAVIVQRFVPGERVTVYARPPAGGDEVWVQRGETVSTHPRDSADPIVALALRAEAAIDATATGADVELIDGDQLWVVQARPIVRAAPARTPPPPALLAPLIADGRTWTWDVTHNPDPLSVAQAELVERVERADLAPWSLRVCGGYLYSAPRAAAPPLPPIDSLAALTSRAAALEDALAAALGPDDELSVDDAIARYLAFYRIWARDLVPLIAAARAALTPDLLPAARPSAVEATLLAGARGELSEADVLARLGPLAPAWDVAVPTFAERPDLVRAALARALAAPPPAPPPPEADALARAGADLAERDDLWFARAQWRVRRALLARARALHLAGDDVFWLPLDLDPIDPITAHRLASGARAASARASAWTMPLTLNGPPAPSGPSLRGIGGGPRVTGRVLRLSSLGAPIDLHRGDIIVTRAVTPALAVTIAGCAGLISETGGPLDHGAALARELGIPYVVGCRDAYAQLSTGMIVTLEPSTGTVTIERP